MAFESLLPWNRAPDAMDLKDVRIIVQDVRICPGAVCSCIKVMVASQRCRTWTLPNILLVPLTKNILLMTMDRSSASRRIVVQTPFVTKCFAD